MEMKSDKEIVRFEADYEIVLECIYEVYTLEEEHLCMEADFRKTMVLPFMKMLERYCGSIRIEDLHKVLWGVYQESMGAKDFLEKAEMILRPYCTEEPVLEQEILD